MSAQIVNYLFEKYGNWSTQSTFGDMEISVDVPGPFGQLKINFSLKENMTLDDVKKEIEKSYILILKNNIDYLNKKIEIVKKFKENLTP
jgi:hypothetical protein